ncbi:MAG: hypothetical protein P9X24_17290 [Candidatus Hatepunaea meridiana]|nr:hypothetical protein [Candidatus Hatepunaea meridiana]
MMVFDQTLHSENKSNLTFRAGIFDYITNDIQTAILEDNRPWVVGFSGGKDSTLLMELVYYSLASIPPDLRTKQIYVLASDTRIETPDIPTEMREVFRIDIEKPLVLIGADN